jgi:hypothetical protein
MDLGRLAPVSEVAGGQTILKLADHALSKMEQLSFYGAQRELK